VAATGEPDYDLGVLMRADPAGLLAAADALAG
jgi:hypothetical protein